MKIQFHVCRGAKCVLVAKGVCARRTDCCMCWEGYPHLVLIFKDNFQAKLCFWVCMSNKTKKKSRLLAYVVFLFNHIYDEKFFLHNQNVCNFFIYGYLYNNFNTSRHYWLLVKVTFDSIWRQESTCIVGYISCCLICGWYTEWL